MDVCIPPSGKHNIVACSDLGFVAVQGETKTFLTPKRSIVNSLFLEVCWPQPCNLLLDQGGWDSVAEGGRSQVRLHPWCCAC